ncbi:unnamed protein product, partial [Sphacelaria rigidula]
MGSDPDKSPPFFFTKPADAIVDASRPAVKIPYPQQTADLQHEVELVVALGKGAQSYLQREAKELGRPWDCSKGFDCSGPVGALIPIRKAAQWRIGGELGQLAEPPEFVPLAKRKISLTVDGELRQDSVLGEMVWSIPDMVSRLSQ